MTDEFFMKLAIKEARKSSEPLPCGAVIVKNGEVIAKTFNSQRRDNNVTSHAETKAIGKAGKILGNKNLYECVIYSTHEPCSMCFAAINHAKLKKLVFGVSLRDIPVTPHKIAIEKNFMEKEVKNLLQ